MHFPRCRSSRLRSRSRAAIFLGFAGAFLTLGFGAGPAAFAEGGVGSATEERAEVRLPPIGVSLHRIRSGFRRGFSWTSEGGLAGHEVHVGRSADGRARIVCLGPRSRLAWVACEVSIASTEVLRKRIEQYTDPPLRDTVRTGLGGAHARRVRVRQPRPYAFAVRSEDPPEVRASCAAVRRLAAVAARTRIPLAGSLAIRRGSGGILLHDPFLDWVVRGLARGLQGESVRLERRGLRVDLELDAKARSVRFAIRAVECEGLLGPDEIAFVVGQLSSEPDFSSGTLSDP